MMFKDYKKWHRENYNFCVICGKSEGLQQHHVISVGTGRNRNKNLPEHLTVVMLCQLCHHNVHNINEDHLKILSGVNLHKQVLRQIMKYFNDRIINKNLDEEFRNVDYYENDN